MAIGITSPNIIPFMLAPGCRAQIGEKAKSFGMTKACIVTDKVIEGTGLLDAIFGGFKAVGLDYVVFDGVLPDPTDEIVDKGAAVALENKCDGVVAIGGGASLDTGKAICLLLDNPGPARQWFMPNLAGPCKHPIITVPTTAGSGAECTSGSMISYSDTHVKSVIPYIGVINYIFVDPECFVSMPLMPSIYCAFDALTHAMDLMTSNWGEELGEVLCAECIRLVREYVPKLIEDPKNVETRAKLALAANLAGQSLNSNTNGTTFTHSIGHSIGAKVGMQHGLACAECLPQCCEKLADASPEKFRRFCGYMGFDIDPKLSDREYGKKAKALMLEFMKSVGIKNMKELGYKLEDLLEAVPLMLTDFLTVMKWPAQLDYDDFVDMVTEAYDQ